MNTAQHCPFYSLLRVPKAKPHTFEGPDAESKTQQHFLKETDTNAIVRRAIATGEPVPFKPGGAYGDFSILTDYHQALQMVNDAGEAFNALPAKVRKRFENDPGKLLTFLNDPANYEEGVALGFYEGPKDKVTVPPGTVLVETLKTDDKGPPATPRA